MRRVRTAVVVAGSLVVAALAVPGLASAEPPLGTKTARKFRGTPTVGALFDSATSKTHFCTASVVASPHGNVLITAATRARLGAELLTRQICQVRAVNISEAVDLYELMTETGNAAQTLCQQYEAALREFHQQNYRQSAKILGSILDEYPDDGPAVVLLSRVADRLVNPTSEFKPYWDLPGK